MNRPFMARLNKDATSMLHGVTLFFFFFFLNRSTLLCNSHVSGSLQNSDGSLYQCSSLICDAFTDGIVTIETPPSMSFQDSVSHFSFCPEENGSIVLELNECLFMLTDRSNGKNTYVKKTGQMWMLTFFC